VTVWSVSQVFFGLLTFESLNGLLFLTILLPMGDTLKRLGSVLLSYQEHFPNLTNNEIVHYIYGPSGS